SFAAARFNCRLVYWHLHNTWVSRLSTCTWRVIRNQSRSFTCFCWCFVGAQDILNTDRCCCCCCCCLQNQPVLYSVHLLVLEKPKWGHFGDTLGHSTQRPIYCTAVVTLGSAVCNVRENPWSIMLG
ncbi:unnamed protein product, partial [Ectocarpus sp. 12 AP-2014]